MTRDEAIEIELKSSMGWKPVDMSVQTLRQAASETIDAYVALGMLKLEEPEPVDRRANYAMNKIIFEKKASLCAGDLHQALDRAGLRIVEKQPKGQ